MGQILDLKGVVELPIPSNGISCYIALKKIEREVLCLKSRLRKNGLIMALSKRKASLLKQEDSLKTHAKSKKIEKTRGQNICELLVEEMFINNQREKDCRKSIMYLCKC